MAEIKPSYDTKRQKLSEIIPLDSPLSMYIEPTRTCNFKCFYCMHSTRGEKGGVLDRTGFQLAHMEMELYDKIVSEIMQFKTAVKRICFSGLGDPLMNPRLPEMIQKLRKAGFSGRIDVISNGALLTHEFTDALIGAGLNRLQISIQGLDSAQYQENCGVAVDVDQLIRELQYFHSRAQGTDAALFVKIIDIMLRDDTDRARFFEMFGGCCDTIFVEHLVIMEQQMGDHGGRTDHTRNLNGEYVEKRTVCGVMFYFLQLNIDGETFPCSTPGLPNAFSMGCVKEQTLQQIWDGERRHGLLCTNLKSGYAVIPACKECSSCIAIADDTEYLDDCREEMLARIEP